MRTISKRLVQQRQKVDRSQFYNITDAINLVKETSTAKFIESIEAHISLYLDPKYADQQLRTTVILPHGTGRKLKIAVLTSSENLNTATQSGADIVGNDDLVDEIAKGNINFDLLIATPEMMPKLAKLGRILGPKGLMPSPKAGTVSTDLTKTIDEFKKGKLEYRVDKTGIVHISFGKSDFSDVQLFDNLRAFYQSIEKNRPAGVKGKYVKKLAICSTMGPSIFIDTSSIV